MWCFVPLSWRLGHLGRLMSLTNLTYWTVFFSSGSWGLFFKTQRSWSRSLLLLTHIGALHYPKWQPILLVLKRSGIQTVRHFRVKLPWMFTIKQYYRKNDEKYFDKSPLKSVVLCQSIVKNVSAFALSDQEELISSFPPPAEDLLQILLCCLRSKLNTVRPS